MPRSGAAPADEATLHRAGAERGGVRMDLADTVVKDTEGRDVRLGELWRDKPAVVVFVRHYG